MFIKNYIYNLFASISNISFYKKLEKIKLSSVLLFFILSFVILGAWLSAEIIMRDFSQLQTEFEQTLEQIKINYPDDLTTDLNQTLDIKKVLPFVLIPMYLVFVFFNTILDAFLTYLIIQYFFKLNFKYVLKISLHIAVIAGLVERISSSLYANHHYPLYSISYWIIILFVFWNLRKESFNKK